MLPRAIPAFCAFALLAALAVLPRPAAAQPARDEVLRIDSHLTYDVRPDAGPVHVTWQLNLQNNDPSTAYQEFGVSYYYSSLSVPVFRGASAVGATGPGGAGLSVGVDTSGSEAIDVATVTFDRLLFYGDTYSFTLGYDLPGARTEALLITPAYVFLPAMTLGDSSTVSITTTADPAWDVSIEGVECEGAGGEYTCAGSDNVQVAAVVEVSRPGALENTVADVPLPSGPIALTTFFFTGENAWAERMRAIAEAALPVLEGLFGAPYDGPRALAISERGRQDIAGYEGIFSCTTGGCNIGISPVANDHAAMHELAHLWTEPFSSRWLAEGLAEFMARRAEEQLGGLVSAQPATQPPGFVDFPLEEWGAVRFMIGANEGEVAREASGYWEALRFFQSLESQIGLEAIQRANAAASGGPDVDSERYFDLLSEASDADLDGLFLAEVFPASYRETLAQRREVRARFDTVTARAEASSLEMPANIEELVDDWDFDQAAAQLDLAEAALAAYEHARERVDGSRSIWQRIGLIRKDPEAELRRAAASFQTQDLEGARLRAESASQIIDDASRAGMLRVLIAAGVLAGTVALLGGGVWFVRRQLRHGAAS